MSTNRAGDTPPSIPEKIPTPSAEAMQAAFDVWSKPRGADGFDWAKLLSAAYAVDFPRALGPVPSPIPATDPQISDAVVEAAARVIVDHLLMDGSLEEMIPVDRRDTLVCAREAISAAIIADRADSAKEIARLNEIIYGVKGPVSTTGLAVEAARASEDWRMAHKEIVRLRAELAAALRTRDTEASNG